MDYSSMQPTDIERQNAKEVIENTLKYEKLNLSDKELDLLTNDILDTLSAIGGDFSTKNIRSMILDYIKSDFYPRFKYMHRNEI